MSSEFSSTKEGERAREGRNVDEEGASLVRPEKENDLGDVVVVEAASKTCDDKEDIKDENEGNICRVCRCPGDEDNVLYRPCLCNGSISYIHKECLLSWLEHSNRKSCELCGHNFKLTPLYAANAPRVLPLREVVALCAQTVLKKIPAALHFVLVCTSWIVIIPILICWMYRVLQRREIYPELAIETMVDDWQNGNTLCVLVVVSLLALISFADYVSAAMGGYEEEDDDDFDIEEDVVEEREIANERPNRLDRILQDRPAADVNGEHDDPVAVSTKESKNATDGSLGWAYDRSDDDVAQGQRESFDSERTLDDVPTSRQSRDDYSEAIVDGEDRVAHKITEDVGEEKDGEDEDSRSVSSATDERANGDGDIDGRRRRPPMQNGIRNGDNDDDDDDDDDANDFDGVDDEDFEHGLELHLALDELLGFRGPPFTFLRNMAWVLFFVGAYMSALAMFPMHIGRFSFTRFEKLGLVRAVPFRGALMSSHDFEDFVQTRYRPFFGGERPTQQERTFDIKHVPNLVNKSSVIDLMIKSEGWYEWNDRATKSGEGVSSHRDRTKGDQFTEYFTHEHFLSQKTIDTFEVTTAAYESLVPFELRRSATPDLGANVLVDVGFFFLGWAMLTLSFVLLRLGLVSSFDERRSSQIPLVGQAKFLVNFLTNVMKVTWLLLLKIFALPIACGYLIEYSASPTFGFDIDAIVAFFAKYPACSLLVHWVGGVTFMLFVTIFMLELHEELHPDVLSRIIRLPDPNEHMLRMLLRDPISQHANRTIVSALIYGSAILLLFVVPTSVATLVRTYIGIDLLPTRLHVFYPLTVLQIPMEMAALYLISIHAVDVIKTPLRRCHKAWLYFMCDALGLEGYLLPRPLVRDGMSANDDKDAPRVNGERKRADEGDAAADGEEGARRGDRRLNGQPEMRAAAAAERRNLLPMPVRQQAAHGLRGRRGVRGRLGWDRLSAEERAKDLRPRDKAPPYVVCRLFALCVAGWSTVALSLYFLFFVSLGIGRTFLEVVIRIDHAHGHDPLALSVGAALSYACALLAWKFQNYARAMNQMSGILRNPALVQSTKLLLVGFGVVPLAFGCFVSWSVAGQITMPSHEDWALGFVIQCSTIRFGVLADMFPGNRDTVDLIDTALRDPAALRALFNPSISWMLLWTKHAVACMLASCVFMLGLSTLIGGGDDDDNDADIQNVSSTSTSQLLFEDAVQYLSTFCALALRAGLFTSSASLVHSTFGAEMKRFFKTVHNAMYKQRYCIGWRLHDHDIHRAKEPPPPPLSSVAAGVERKPHQD